MARISSPDRSSSNTAPALTIAAASMPAQGTFWLSSEVDGIGGTNPATATGHTIDGHKADIARVRLVVTNWDALTGIQMQVELDDGLGYALLEPPVAFDSFFAGEHFDLTGGKVVIKATLGTSPIILPVAVKGARRFRFGFTPADANAHAQVALSAGFRLIQSRLYA